MSLQEGFDSTYVCLDRYCPKVFDPHTNVVMCRCYQTQAVSHPSSYALQGSYGRRINSPPSYPTSLSYGDSQTVPQSACSSYLGYSSGSDAYGMYPNVFSQLSPTNVSNPDLSMYGSYVQSTQMDQILRSQVADFWNYQHLSSQVNGSDIPATKQSTKLLKTWIREHKKNPYPTKTEKVMLAFATRMTMTQISNWFANARRRMKQQKDKGNLSDSAISDISDDDDKSSVCKSPAPPADVNMHKQTAKDTFFSLSDTNVKEYLRESERITKPLIIDETEARSTIQSASVIPETNNDDSTDKKVQLPLSVLTEVKTPPMQVKSKIWVTGSVLY